MHKAPMIAKQAYAMFTGAFAFVAYTPPNLVSTSIHIRVAALKPAREKSAITSLIRTNIATSYVSYLFLYIPFLFSSSLYKPVENMLMVLWLMCTGCELPVQSCG